MRSESRPAGESDSGVERRSQAGFAGRLLIAQALVLIAGAVTTWLVASAVGPEIFRDHVRRAGVAHTASETRHLEEAFSAALLISISLALLAAGAAALAVTWYLSRRVHRSVAAVAAAASQIAVGRRGTRVADPGLGTEFGTLAATYNALAERLEATDTTRRRMLGDLAHEMRTPLATIDAHLEAVEDGVRDLDQDTLGVIRGSTRRLYRLAEDIAAVSRAEEGNLHPTPHPVHAATLAQAAGDGARDHFTAKGVHLHLPIETQSDTDDLVLVDVDRIGQVLGNLLDNALCHTPAGGTITLSCRRNERWVEFVVVDTGEGIAPQHLGHVFDRFYRADTARDRSRGGSGIGLSIAKALTEAHGGRIAAQSAGAGHGATFIVSLPAGGP